MYAVRKRRNPSASLPSKQAARLELLEGLKLEGSEVAEEFDDAGGRVLIEAEAALGPLVEIVEVALDRQEHQPAGGDVSGQHVAAVPSKGRDVTARRPQKLFR